MDLLIAEVLAAFFSRIFMTVGRIVVYMLTLGQWRGERVMKDEGRIHSAAGALSFVRDGQRVITCTGLSFVGFATCLFALVMLVLFA